jgi:hypothetical protein
LQYHLLTMKAFAEAFFQHFGAQIQANEDELIVDLPAELVPTFGKERLYLVFPQGQGEGRELSPVEDVLVYGSRVFDQMLGLLAGRGEVASLYFPERVTVALETLPSTPLPLYDCRLSERRVEAVRDQFYLFHFRATYLSDEKREEFVSVILDSEGVPFPELQGLLDQINPDLTLLDHPFPVNATHITQLSAKAGDVARCQLQVQVAPLEAAIKARLERVLLRLSTYYRRLLAEVNSGDPAQDETIRADLERDLKQKMAEELERHRLRVTLTPLSVAVASVPLIYYYLDLNTNHTRQKLKFAQELYLGQLIPLLCYHCQERLDHLALCDRDHVVHAHCRKRCQRCNRVVCHTCGIQNCAICQDIVCVDCQSTCAFCDRWLCAQHLNICPICESSHCSDHGFHCRWCQQAYCQQCGVGGECRTCQAVMEAPVVEPETVPVIAGLHPARYEWQRAENKQFQIYIGYRATPGFLVTLLGRRQIILVTNNAGEIVYQRERGWWERLLKRS